ncbi:MAG: S8 family serine peptidase, partial [Bacteroidota bacterium]
MQKFFALLGLVFFTYSQAISQNPHFLSRFGEKISLTENTSSLCLYFHEKVARGSMKFRAEHEVSNIRYSYGNEGKRVIIDFDQEKYISAWEVAKNLGIKIEQLKSASWAQMLDGGMNVWLTHRVLFDKKEEADWEKLAVIWSEYSGASANHFETGYAYVDINRIEEVIPLANQLYKSGLVKWAQPNFSVVALTQSLPENPVKVNNDSFPTDSLFNKLFYLHNTGQNPLADLGFWQGGTADVDIDAPEAWGIETGSSDITIAIVDQGVTDHEDLMDDNGTGNSRLVLGWTADPSLTPGGVPQLPEAAHGEGVAGIIAASHNSIGVTGICPECEIISATAFVEADAVDQSDPTDIQYLANSINWGWQNGGDIINNSWVLDICGSGATSLFAPIEAAIDDAKTLGRGGLGCPVIFASGQFAGKSSYPYDCVAYPANLSQVIAVGAIDLQGNFPAYVNYGPEMDIVAPTSRMVGTTPGQGMENSVTTMDLYPDGYNTPTANLNYPNMKYNRYFGGTSTSSSVVTGVVALIMSRNSTLTATEVTNILLSSAVDVNTPGFDNLTGNGMANAFDALSNTPAPIFPVEYLSFTGKAVNQHIQLKWETLQEINNDYFAVEKRIGNSFINIGERVGAGNVQALNTYSFIDESPQIGSNIYRLKQVDFDGEFEYSQILEIVVNPEELGLSTRLYPNPAKEELHLELIDMDKEEVNISISDLQGREIFHNELAIQSDW